jgi:hypothetical protein
MIEYGTIAFKGLSSAQLELLPYFIFAGIVLVLNGYWIKKTMGALIGLSIVVSAFLFFTNSFHSINW